ncbi:MAG: class I SAM-dependent methyltransferase [Candidatus Woesearchaeota archaeon]
MKKLKNVEETKFRFFGDKNYYDITYFFLNDYEGEAKFIKKLLNKSKISPYKTSLLDIGCGTGNLFLYLKDFKALFGVDISKKLIKIARNKKIKNAKFISKDIKKLNLKKKFNIIYISTFLIQTFPNIKILQRFLNKIKKNLKEKGIIIFSWIDERDYSKTYKDGQSQKRYLQNKWSFNVTTYKINRKRYFKITFYDENNKMRLGSEALYLTFSKELLKNLAKRVNMKIIFFRNFGLKEPYQKWAVLCRNYS